MSAPPRLRTCEFGHLMELRRVPPCLTEVLGPEFYGHVHEDDALSCAVFADMGWPEPQVIDR